jgi:hypothetical protein
LGSLDLCAEQAYPAVVEVPYIDHGLFNNIKEAVEKGRDFLADAYNKEEKNIFFKHFFETQQPNILLMQGKNGL